MQVKLTMANRKRQMKQVQVWCSADFYALVGQILNQDEWSGYCISDLGQHLVRTETALRSERSVRAERGKAAVLSVRLNQHLYARLKGMARKEGCTMSEAMRRLFAAATGR